MVNQREEALNYAHAQYDKFLESLCSLVSIPSISTDPDQNSAMIQAASWLKSELLSVGLHEAQVFTTEGHPIVFSSFNTSRPDAKTVLIYGHYDVQPADPLSEWKTKPFQPTLLEDNLYGRGASDMKGQVIACIKGVESILKFGDPGVNIKFLIEGEEEIGSPSLEKYLESYRDLLRCDVILNADGGMFSECIPSITYSLRGIAFFELRIYGPSHDLHSGSYGGAVHNPAQVLCELIAGMHDANGKVALPGFYDKVRALSSEEREAIVQLPITDQTYIDETGVTALWEGEKGFTPVERIGARPTLEINGMISGFTGQGTKTIIPAFAMAKISTRLVADQIPEDVRMQILDYLNNQVPNTVKWELIPLHGGAPTISDRDHPTVKAMVAALDSVWNVKPVFVRNGGSVPVITNMQKILGVNSVNTGFGLPDDRIHSPNEKLHLPTWRKGIDAIIHFISNISAA